MAAIAFDEPRAPEAEALLAQSRIAAPRLLAYELANVARTKSLREPRKAADIQASLADALALDIQWHDVDHVAVLRLALETGLSTYDASYVWLARALPDRSGLVTFDEKVRAASQGT